MNTYNKILETFTYKTKQPFASEEWILNPFIVGNNVYATDKHVMVWFDKSKVDNAETFKEVPFDKIEKIIPTVLDLKKTISISELENSLAKCKTEDDFDELGNDITCNECKGEGEVEWEYNGHYKDFECPICWGDGLTSKKRLVPNGKKIIEQFQKIKILQSYFSARYLKQFLDIAIEFNEPLVILSQSGKHSSTMLTIGDVNFIIMPLMINDSSLEDVADEIM